MNFLMLFLGWNWSFWFLGFFYYKAQFVFLILNNGLKTTLQGQNVLFQKFQVYSNVLLPYF